MKSQTFLYECQVLNNMSKIMDLKKYPDTTHELIKCHYIVNPSIFFLLAKAQSM